MCLRFLVELVSNVGQLYQNIAVIFTAGSCVCVCVCMCLSEQVYTGENQAEKPVEMMTVEEGEEDEGRCDELLSAGDCVRLRSVCVCACMRVCVCLCARTYVHLLSFMSLCQNKLIMITGAKAGIQKFISTHSTLQQCEFVC